jgi:hypothetical protein
MRVPMALVLAVLLLPALGVAGIGHAEAQPLAVSPVPIWGVVIGTIVVAGLVYLLVHAPDGRYYRYPYYGDYYRHYYNPRYRPYLGYYAAAPVILVAPPITGVVLGLIVVGGLYYILTRDAYGYFYRYPYYGPYRQYYYRATYRPYAGPYSGTAYQTIPLRQGDSRWDAPAMHNAPGSGLRPVPGLPDPDPRMRGPRDPRCRDRRPDQPCSDNGPGLHR